MLTNTNGVWWPLPPPAPAVAKRPKVGHTKYTGRRIHAEGNRYWKQFAFRVNPFSQRSMIPVNF